MREQPEGPDYGPDYDGNHDRDHDGDRNPESGPPEGNRVPAGEPYDWYVRGGELLAAGNASAAVQLLGHAAAAEPASRAVREALARAQFGAGLYPEARESFQRIVEANPSDDYAQFGLGLAAVRIGDFRAAVGHLSLAAAMRPDVSHYRKALRRARAALRR